MNNKIKIPVARLRQIIQEEVSRFYEVDSMEDAGSEETAENAVEEIERDDYAYNTNKTYEFAESEELEPLLSGTQFENLEIIDGMNRRKIEEFTHGEQNGSMILPLKKKDGFIYFKTNEKTDTATQGKYYKVAEKDGLEEQVSSTELTNRQVGAEINTALQKLNSMPADQARAKLKGLGL